MTEPLTLAQVEAIAEDECPHREACTPEGCTVWDWCEGVSTPDAVSRLATQLRDTMLALDRAEAMVDELASAEYHCPAVYDPSNNPNCTQRKETGEERCRKHMFDDEIGYATECWKAYAAARLATREGAQ